MTTITDVVAGVTRDGATLRFSGTLLRAAVPHLWAAALPVTDGVRRLDLGEVTRIDSAGLALAVELAARSGAADVSGSPPGLAELRAAYRLSPALAFANR